MTWLDETRRNLAAETILDAAAELFRANGVAATGMAEVAAASGCSRATLYRYFENRQALRVAFVHREARRIGAVVAAQTAHLTDPEQRVVEAVVAALQAVRRDPTLAAWFRPEASGLATELAHASDVIAALSKSFMGGSSGQWRGDGPEARWLVRVIVSLLTVPGADEAEERELLSRFVAPALTGARQVRT